MTINLLTSVAEGMVLLADSMSTMQGATANGPVTTTFPNAEKLLELGSSLPAAAMINGLGILRSDVVSVLLKRASRALDQRQYAPDAVGVETAVAAQIDPSYAQALNDYKSHLAAFWSRPEQIGGLNLARVQRGLPLITQVDPARVKVTDDPLSPTDPLGWDVGGDFALTVIVASYFDAARATAISWPGPRSTVFVPGPSPLSWWGSGGSSISRIVLGFDTAVLARIAAQGDALAQSALAFATSRGDLQMPIPISAMPLQDAVEFTEYLGQVSSGFDRFSSGPAAVGGPLDVMILQHQHREWIRRKRIHSSIA